jgi:ATP phosphoribosyltransferase
MSERKNRLRLALPKGSLQEETLRLFWEAGYHIDGYHPEDRDYRPTIDDPEVSIKVLRPQEIPMYLAEGLYDLGISGLDWLMETQYSSSFVPVEEVLDLQYGEVQIVLAVPRQWEEVNSFQDLYDMHYGAVRIASEYLNISSRYIYNQIGVEPTRVSLWHPVHRLRTSNVKLILSFGASEGKPPEDCEAIIDNATRSARTIQANGLKIIDTIIPSSTARLLVCADSLRDPWKSDRIAQIKERLEEAVCRRNESNR